MRDWSEALSPRLAPRALLSVLLALAAGGCAEVAGDDVPALLPLGAQRVAVNETLRLELAVSNPDGLSLSFDVDPLDLPGFEGVTQLSGTPAGGLFLWTPLVSHVGTHELRFTVRSDLGTSEQAVAVEVVTASSSAPVFLRPGAGGTYDLEVDPCVAFDIEVRDDDSASVTIGAAEALPDEARIDATGPKQARFSWCPSAAQIAAAERWTVALQAADAEHPATRHDYVVVLRTPPKDGCPGEPPSITVVSPAEGQRVPSNAGFPVTVRVTDDTGLRDDPLLYYSTTEPDDRDAPDLTTFELTPFVRSGDTWTARVPSLGLADGEERAIWTVVSATDNDDPSGTTCDQRAETPVLRFVGVGGTGASLAVCQACDRSADCAFEICASGPSGGTCLEPCIAGACSDGTCEAVGTTEGAATRACGPVVAVCGSGGPGACTDDAGEDDDDIASARLLGASERSGQICAGDVDLWAIEVGARERVEVTLSFDADRGDLDLDLVDGDGALLDRSEGVEDTEVVSYVSEGAETVYAIVLGFLDDQNAYRIAASYEDAPCEDDDSEPDDVRRDATPYPGDVIEGTICPDDDDWIAFDVTAPSRVEVVVAFDWLEADLDAELYGPGGERLAFSNNTDTDEEIARDLLVRGEYAVRIFGFSGTSTDYLVEIDLSALSGGCEGDEYCGANQVCDGGVCVAGACSGASGCPPGYLCPAEDPAPSVGFCGASCSVNADCRPGDACKWFVGGRGCGDTGSALNGARCASFADCGGQRTCYGWPGGYCARAGCSSSGDCEPGTHCILDGSVGVCALDCFDSDDICRLGEGYECDLVRDTEGQLEFVCLGS